MRLTRLLVYAKAYTSRIRVVLSQLVVDEVGERIRKLIMNMVQQLVVNRVLVWFSCRCHSRRVSGITNLSLNSIDVFGSLDTGKSVAYDLDGQRKTTIQLILNNWNVATLHEEVTSWSEDITGVHNLEDLLRMRVTMFIV